MENKKVRTYSFDIPQSTPLADPIAAAYALDAPAIKAGDPMSINDLVAAIRELERRKMLKDGIFPRLRPGTAAARAAEQPQPLWADGLLARIKTMEDTIHTMNVRMDELQGTVDDMELKQMRLEDKVYLLEAQQMVLNTVLQKFGYCPMFE
jgi:hypothetical protein